MLRQTLVLLSLGMAAEASAQPPGKTAPRPRSEPALRVGHKYILLGAALAMCNELGGHPGAEGSCGSGEAFAGWAFGRWAVMAWGRARIGGDDTGFADLGIAARAWLPDLPRLYGELRAGREEFEIGHWEYDFAGSPEREGAVVGGGLGLEILTDAYFTIDARVTVDRGITADTDDYTLVSAGLGVHIY